MKLAALYINTKFNSESLMMANQLKLNPHQIMAQKCSYLTLISKRLLKSSKG